MSFCISLKMRPQECFWRLFFSHKLFGCLLPIGCHRIRSSSHSPSSAPPSQWRFGQGSGRCRLSPPSRFGLQSPLFFIYSFISFDITGVIDPRTVLFLHSPIIRTRFLVGGFAVPRLTRSKFLSCPLLPSIQVGGRICFPYFSRLQLTPSTGFPPWFYISPPDHFVFPTKKM